MIGTVALEFGCGVEQLGDQFYDPDSIDRDDFVVIRREMGSLGLARDAVIEREFKRQSDVYAGISISKE